MKKHTEHNLLTLLSVCCVAVVAIAVTILFMNESSSDSKALDRSSTPAPAPYDYRSDIPESNVSRANYIVDYADNIADPAILASLSTNIAVARITSVDGAETYSEIYDNYALPSTYGRMVILDNLKGELPVGSELEYYRSGGFITRDQADRLLTPDQLTYKTQLRNNTSKAESEWVHYLSSENIDIEAGKTYLVYLIPESVYSAQPNTYAIIGDAYGLRELDPESSGDNYDFSSATVLNNHTETWESLRDLPF